ncbi:MAG: aspartyl/asparaginyl beta-hydroxylase domain-containing protein [Gammaproteobacteria bacterium]
MNNDTPSRWRRWRRTTAHRAGKRFLRRLTEFQARHSSIPTTPFLPNSTFDWVPRLEAAWPGIRAEFDQVWTHPEDIPAFHQISPDQARISKGDQWKTYALFIFGQPVEPNCSACPQTAAALAALPGLLNAWFSILSPGYHIPAHRGPTRALVRCHLGLRVPAARERCWIRVDKEIYHWREGACVLFDDTYEHEVANDTTEHRAVLFIDIDRPMDRTGRWVNAGILRLMKASHYVKDPLHNLAEWNRRLARRRTASTE